MNRRRFLAGGVAGMALVVGCVSRSPGSGGPETDDRRPTTVRTTERGTPARPTDSTRMTEETPPQTETAVQNDEIQRRVSLASVDDVPAKHRLTIEVELLESTVTAARTARLRVTTANTGPKRKISIAAGKCNLFNRDGGASEPAGLWLSRSESVEWIDREGDRWTRDRPQSKSRAYAMYGCSSRPYPEGDSVVNEYLVWDDYRVEGYMTPGTYRFAERVRIKPPNARLDTEPTAEFAWGFSVAVEKP